MLPKNQSCTTTTASDQRAEAVAEALPRATRTRNAPPRLARHAAWRSTGAVSGRTPRQTKNDSAACSTSMPRPSRGARARGPRRGEKRRLAPVDHVVGERAAARTAEAGSGGASSSRPAEVALMIRSNDSSPQVLVAARRARRGSAAASACALRHGAVGDHQLARRPLRRSAPTHALRRAARAHQQDARAAQVEVRDCGSGRAPGRRRRCCRRTPAPRKPAC